MRILAIDGGGIRGLIPAVVLADLERRTGRRTAELFDLIAGTSTGGILACGLARPAPGGGAGPAFSATDLIGLYEREGRNIFHRSLLKRITSVEGALDELYDDRGLRAALRSYLDGASLSQTVTELFVPAYDIERRKAFFFRSTRARTDRAQDFRLADVARATSAAPTYFEPVRVRDAAGASSYALIDGGVFALNPAMSAYADLAAAGREDDIQVLVSLGTGSHTRPFALDKARGWGRLEWARPLIDVVADGLGETVDFELARVLPDGRYVRLQIDLAEASDDLDDAGDANLRALRREADRLVQARAADLERLAAALTRG